jgi:hypothetical protein
MPRKCVKRNDARRYKAHTDETLEECLRAIESKVLTQRKAAAEYKNVGPPGFPEFPPIFTNEEELQFCGCIERMGHYGFPLSEFDLRVDVKACLDKIGQKVT